MSMSKGLAKSVDRYWKQKNCKHEFIWKPKEPMSLDPWYCKKCKVRAPQSTNNQ